MEDGLLVRGQRETKPLLLKLGFALALSLASYFASQFRSKPRISPPKPSSGDDGSKETQTESPTVGAGGLKDELQILSNEEALAKIMNGTSSESGFLMPEFDQFVTKEFLMPEFDQFVMKEFEECPDRESNDVVDEGFKFEEREEMEKEIAYLGNLVEALKEREKTLEMQMIEYYGLKEQVASIRELENRLKVNAMESKMLNLKIESLQSDNQKLRDQVLDYPKVVVELERAREEIEVLKKKLKVDGEQAKEKLGALHRKITELLEKEYEHVEDEVEVDKKLKRLKELEGEVLDLRMVNARLADENLKFIEQLESVKMEYSSKAKQYEIEALEEANNLREENENLKTTIEQLQTDRCTDIEELVYLRWVNACLRYELRNYHPNSGKTVAKDLSKCLSPESERKAKQLIMEYANSGAIEKNDCLFDFDTESCASSRTSSEEYSDTSFDVSSSTKNSHSSKSKFLSKLKKLVVGKDKERSKLDTSSFTYSTRRASVSPCSEEMNGRRNSFESISSYPSLENGLANQLNGLELHSKAGQSQRPPRASLDVQRMRMLNIESKESVGERSRSDLGMSHGPMRMISEESSSDLCRVDVKEKAKLKKFADVLKGSHGPLKSKRR